MLRLQTSQLKMRIQKKTAKLTMMGDEDHPLFIIRMSFTKGPNPEPKTRYCRYYHTSEKKGSRARAGHGAIGSRFFPKTCCLVARDGSTSDWSLGFSMAARLQSKGSQDQAEEASARGTQLDVGGRTGGLDSAGGGAGGGAAGAASAVVGY
jgi:hypothetical protein